MSEVENQEVETVEPNAVEELINQITTGDLNKAEGSFKSLVQDKMADALEAQRIATAQAIFNGSDDDLLDDVEDDEDILDDDTDTVSDEELDAVDQVMDEDEEILGELDDDESV
jgi:hypothetical protein